MISTRIEVVNVKKSDVEAPQVGRLQRAGRPGEARAQGERQELRSDVLTPIISAAVSSSRIAPQARPIRERSRLRATTIAITTRAIPKYGAATPEVAPNLIPKITNGSIGLIPSGPPVRLMFSR